MDFLNAKIKCFFSLGILPNELLIFQSYFSLIVFSYLLRDVLIN